MGETSSQMLIVEFAQSTHQSYASRSSFVKLFHKVVPEQLPYLILQCMLLALLHTFGEVDRFDIFLTTFSIATSVISILQTARTAFLKALTLKRSNALKTVLIFNCLVF